jgi:hypothetical protein
MGLPLRPWQRIAHELAHQTDSTLIVKLSEELKQAMAEQMPERTRKSVLQCPMCGLPMDVDELNKTAGALVHLKCRDKALAANLEKNASPKS